VLTRRTRTTPFAALLALLAALLAPPAGAEPVAGLPEPAGRSAAADPARRIETARTTTPVAPGVELTSFDWYERGDAGGWIRGDALTVDLGAGTRVDYLDPGEVSRAEPLSAQAARTRAVAAVNGDFFDIDGSDAPLGVGVRGGELVKSPVAGHQRAAGVDAEGIGRVMEVFFTGSATLPGGRTLALDQLNSARIDADGTGVFTPLWGSYPRARAVAGAARVTEVVVRDGVVTRVDTTAGADPVPAGGFVLLGREAGADALAALAPGDPVGVEYSSRTADGSTPLAAIGGGELLIADGEVVAPADPLHPRTAVGFSADGRRMFLLVVDGRRSPYLLGLTQRDLAAVLREMGAHNALNLDGGGSSTMLARRPGTDELALANTPSDGAERPVPNGLALYAPEGSGRLTGFRVGTAADAAASPGADPVPGGRPDRVFPGLTRRLVAHGHDETWGPADDRAHSWRTEPREVGRVDDDGVFHAARTGTVTATAHRGPVSGSVGLTVIGPLSRLSPTAPRLALPAAGSSGRIGLVGHDDNGFSAPVEPADAVLEHDSTVVDVAADDDGGLLVTGKRPGSTTVSVRVGEHTTSVPVTVGLEERLIAGFDDGAAWTFRSARATGSVAPVPDGRTGAGLELRYDFSRSTGTRTAHVVPPSPIEVPGQPLALGAWVHGHSGGEWTAFTVTDAQGQTRSLHGPHITWDGWRYLEIAVPTETAFPLRVDSFYTIETAADRQYSGTVLVDDLVAKVPPHVDLPVRRTGTDRVVVRDGTVGGSAWRFAVMSDAQFVARAPDSDLVRQARRTLREIRAQRPDFLVVNGDLVDEAAPEDLALAHRVLIEELGDEVPWYYVPGNHEIMGPGTIENFRREFGATNRTFDHRGTRFVLLDSSTGTIRGGGFDQALMLRAALDGARGDDAVHSVVLVEHHPARDPTPARASQLADRMEAAAVEGWLADFQRETGKGAAMISGHVGAFSASRVDGVPQLINGNAGKAPAADAADGGFTGWTLLGVDPPDEALGRAWPQRPRPQWLRAEFRPHVDALDLRVPEVVRTGEPGAVSATVTQGTRRVPVAAPVSADWSGSPALHVGDPAGVRPWHVARLDPETGELTAFAAGRVVVAVTVNGETRRAEVALTAARQRPRAS
jgi:hypothetical protein